MSARRIDVQAVAPQPWKNGAGLTRELAVQPPGAGMDDFEWRVSVARVAQDGPFSAFPGVDRCITLLRGAGMQLTRAGGAAPHRLDTIGAPFHFRGDEPIDARLIDGSCEDLNVMVRRGRWHAELRVIREAQDVAAADAGLLLCLSGCWRGTGRDDELPPMHAWLWHDDLPAMRVTPQAAAGLAVLVRLHARDEDRRA